MKRLLSLIYGWFGGAFGGGLFLTVSYWIYDTANREYSTFRIPQVLFQGLMMSLWVGIVMIPGALIALTTRVMVPAFRGPLSLLFACSIGILTMLGFVALSGWFNQTDFGTRAFLVLSATLVSALFWWITVKTDRIEQGGGGKAATPADSV